MTKAIWLLPERPHPMVTPSCFSSPARLWACVVSTQVNKQLTCWLVNCPHHTYQQSQRSALVLELIGAFWANEHPGVLCSMEETHVAY